MTYAKYQVNIFAFEYDFSKDKTEGKVGSVPMVRVDGFNLLEKGLVVEDVTTIVDTAFTSAAGAHEVSVGFLGATDAVKVGLEGAFVGDVLSISELSGAGVYDTTAKAPLAYVVGDNFSPLVTIEEEDITAGKIRVIFKCRKY